LSACAAAELRPRPRIFARAGIGHQAPAQSSRLHVAGAGVGGELLGRAPRSKETSPSRVGDDAALVVDDLDVARAGVRRERAAAARGFDVAGGGVEGLVRGPPGRADAPDRVPDRHGDAGRDLDPEVGHSVAASEEAEEETRTWRFW